MTKTYLTARLRFYALFHYVKYVQIVFNQLCNYIWSRYVLYCGFQKAFNVFKFTSLLLTGAVTLKNL